MGIREKIVEIIRKSTDMNQAVDDILEVCSSDELRKKVDELESLRMRSEDFAENVRDAAERFWREDGDGADEFIIKKSTEFLDSISSKYK